MERHVTGGPRPPALPGSELQLFEAELFNDSSSSSSCDVTQTACHPTASVSKGNSLRPDFTDDYDSLHTSITARNRRSSGDGMGHDVDDDEDSTSSEDDSRRSSLAYVGGDVTPQIETLEISSGLSRLTVGDPLEVSSAVTSARTRSGVVLMSTSRVRRIQVAPTSPSEVTGPFDYGQRQSIGSSIGSERFIDDNVAIKSSLWQPMKPGYIPMAGHHDGRQAVLIRRTVPAERSMVSVDQEGTFRFAIPIMSPRVAILCAILNVFPGLGTFVSGLTTLCGSRTRFSMSRKTEAIWSNSWVAFLQLITTPVLLLGWIWSLIWAAYFISISKTSYRQLDLPIENDVTIRRAAAQTPYRSNEPTYTTSTTTTVSIQSGPPLILVDEMPPVNTRPPMESSLTSGNISTSPDAGGLIMFTGGGIRHAQQQVVRDPPVLPSHPQVAAHRRLRNQINNHRSGSTQVSPEILLEPGALETIVINNGAFYVAETAGSSSTSGNSSDPRLQRSQNDWSPADQSPYTRKSESTQH